MKKALPFCIYINILFLWLNILTGIQTLRSQKDKRLSEMFSVWIVLHKTLKSNIIYNSLFFLVLTNWNVLK